MAKKKRVGVVVSNKPHKTIVVAIQIRYQHSKYAKTLIKTRKYMAHDDRNQCNAGDLVLIEESAPFSKRKNWVLKDILKSYLN